MVTFATSGSTAPRMHLFRYDADGRPIERVSVDAEGRLERALACDVGDRVMLAEELEERPTVVPFYARLV